MRGRGRGSHVGVVDWTDMTMWVGVTFIREERRVREFDCCLWVHDMWDSMWSGHLCPFFFLSFFFSLYIFRTYESLIRKKMKRKKNCLIGLDIEKNSEKE